MKRKLVQITITVANEFEAEQICEVLTEAEQEGELDFEFNTLVDDFYPPEGY